VGLGDKANSLAQTLVGAEAAFGVSPVLKVACGDYHSLAVTKDGALWTFSRGSHGALGHNDINNILVPTCIETQHFGNATIVAVAGGVLHLAAVTKEGTLYTWVEASGLGHAHRETRWVPTRIIPSLLQRACVRPCHDLLPTHALAFTMGTHSRHGSHAAPTAVVVRGSSQRRSQQQGKTQAAADKGKDSD